MAASIKKKLKRYRYTKNNSNIKLLYAIHALSVFTHNQKHVSGTSYTHLIQFLDIYILIFSYYI